MTAGAAGSRTVVLMNSGAANLTVGGATIKVTDAFAITADAAPA